MKITTVGAGSVAWGPAINIDFLLNPELDGAELMLMDVNPETLDLVRRLLERLIAEYGFRKTIAATTDRIEALRDADYVLTAISVGGDHLWRYDAIFPQIYGIFQPVGDTIGPGGLMRALRHAGPLREIGRTMLEVSKPGAPLLQLTNPMNPLCAALAGLDGLSVYGICHGVDDTEMIFAHHLGVPRELLRIEAAGNNHNIFCNKITIGDETYGHERFAELTPRVLDTPFRGEVWRRYGGLVGNDSRHPIEFLPDFLTPESEFGRSWGVSPLAHEIDPIFGSRQNRARQLLDQALSQSDPIALQSGNVWGGLRRDADGQIATGHSREIIDEFIVALEHGRDFAIHLNVANDGAIAGVSPEYNVEIPVRFAGGAMIRQPVAFNEAITAEIERVGHEQHLLARACVAFDEATLVDALTLDALVPDHDVASRLVRDMVAYQRAYGVLSAEC